MKSFFKSIGKGVLNFLTPFAWIVGISIGGTIGLVIFVILLFYFLFLFFSGRSIFKELPEDKKVKEIKQKNNSMAAPYVSQPVENNQPIENSNNKIVESNDNSYHLDEDSYEDHPIEENKENIEEGANDEFND